MKRETQRGSAIVNVIKSEDVVQIGKEALEIGLDAALDSGVLKEIPIVSGLAPAFPDTAYSQCSARCVLASGAR